MKERVAFDRKFNAILHKLDSFQVVFTHPLIMYRKRDKTKQ